MTQIVNLSERVLAERNPQDGFVLADPIAMGPRSARALDAMVCALLPPAPAPRPAEVEARVAVHVRRMLAYMPPALRLGFVLLSHVIDWSPLWRLRSFRPLHRLTRAEASEILKGLSSSHLLGLRLLLLAPKAMILSTYYDQDEVHAALDYAPRAFIRERVVLRERLLNQPTLHSVLQTGSQQ